MTSKQQKRTKQVAAQKSGVLARILKHRDSFGKEKFKK